MLVELAISDLAIIERTTIHFEEGLNALTGETGAGKSILLDALGAVLGQRVSSDLVRTGAKAARVEAAFDLSGEEGPRVVEILGSYGIEQRLDEPLLLSREISSAGRSSARINGRMSTVAQLNEIGAILVDIHGQSDHLSILQTSEQRSILDRYARLELLRDEVGVLVREYLEVRRLLEDVSRGSREREQRLDLLRFQLGEIDEAGLASGEDERLIREREVLQNADRLRQSAMSAVEALVGDESGAVEVSANALLRQAEHAAADLGEIDETAQELSERATELVVLAEDLVRDLRSYADTIEGDPERLMEVEDRLDLIQTLKRKYGGSIDEILAFRDEADRELQQLTGTGFDREALVAREASISRELASCASLLSEKRSEVSLELSARIVESISELRMGSSNVSVEVRQREDADGIELPDGRRVHVDETGIDEVEFMIAPNAGETLKPLGRIASGGETARVMLAVKSILSAVDETPTLVFDEIDVGVGGRSGQMVGEKLWSLTDRHQVIVISHLAQIAAFADKHFRIVKEPREGRVVSSVQELDRLTREEELAAMLDGVPATPESLANARAMLQRVYDYRSRGMRKQEAIS
ncbi:MAG TPA: DNA repair protein RecN [Thermomicrobiales bacterium]|nr:DNA repair protein RecN [Thermomicrobiales bacterium]